MFCSNVGPILDVYVMKEELLILRKGLLRSLLWISNKLDIRGKHTDYHYCNGDQMSSGWHTGLRIRRS